MPVDLKIAQFYAPLFLNSVKLGESTVVSWFPGAGKTTVLNTIFSQKKILADYLGALLPRLRIVRINEAEDEKLPDFDGVKAEIDAGNEILVVADKVELWEEVDLNRILETFSRLQNISRSRVHFSIHTVDYPKIERVILANLRVVGLMQDKKTMPLISGSLLEEYVTEYKTFYGTSLNNNQLADIAKTTGGVLYLTRQRLRSPNEEDLLKLKLKSVWGRLNPEYQKIIVKHVAGKRQYGNEEKRFADELKQMGVFELSLFDQDIGTLTQNIWLLLEQILTPTEKKLWEYLESHGEKLVAREQFGDLLWSERLEEKYSDWAVDQAISRFRKKLTGGGVDPEKLETVKGKGYVWHK